MAIALSPLRTQAILLKIQMHGLGNKFLATPTAEQLSKIDFSDKSSLEPVVVAVSSVFIGLLTSVVCLRLYVRHIYSGRFYLDDYLVVVAALFTLVVCSTVIAATKYGLGKHIWNLDLANILAELKMCIELMFIINVFYTTAIAFTKLSIIASYNHIFAPRGAAYYTLVASGVVTIGLGIASIPCTILECIPIRGAWNFSDSSAKCYPFTHFLYASTAINTLTDIVLCIVPIPLFWGLDLPRRQKVMVSILFFLGGFACIASIIRLAYLHLLQDPLDVTYDLVHNVVWTMAECTIGIVCVSLPPLRALLARILPVMFKTSLHSSNNNNKKAASPPAAEDPDHASGKDSSYSSTIGSSSGGGGGRGDIIVLSSVGTHKSQSSMEMAEKGGIDPDPSEASGKQLGMMSPMTASVSSPLLVGIHEEDGNSLTVVDSTPGSTSSRADDKAQAKPEPAPGPARLTSKDRQLEPPRRA